MDTINVDWKSCVYWHWAMAINEDTVCCSYSLMCLLCKEYIVLQSAFAARRRCDVFKCKMTKASSKKESQSHNSCLKPITEVVFKTKIILSFLSKWVVYSWSDHLNLCLIDTINISQACVLLDHHIWNVCPFCYFCLIYKWISLLFKCLFSTKQLDCLY